MSISDYTMIAESIHTPSLALLKCVVRRAVTISLSILAVFFLIETFSNDGNQTCISGCWSKSCATLILSLFFYFLFILLCLFSSHLFLFARFFSSFSDESRNLWNWTKKAKQHTRTHSYKKIQRTNNGTKLKGAQRKENTSRSTHNMNSIHELTYQKYNKQKLKK